MVGEAAVSAHDRQTDSLEDSAMVDAAGAITAIDGEHAIVVMDETGCGRCHEEGGCGGNNLGKMFCSTPRTFRVLNPGNALVGDRVRVVIGAGAVRRSALLAYVVPLLALFGGALGGSALADEPGAIAGAIGGVLLAWLALRHAQGRTPDQRFEPHIRY
jgi:sigma-E factor negative regulatory protein RseC